MQTVINVDTSITNQYLRINGWVREHDDAKKMRIQDGKEQKRPHLQPFVCPLQYVRAEVTAERPAAFCPPTVRLGDSV